jgi:hypothetical protein
MCTNPPEEAIEHMLFSCPFSTLGWEKLVCFGTVLMIEGPSYKKGRNNGKNLCLWKSSLYLRGTFGRKGIIFTSKD